MNLRLSTEQISKIGPKVNPITLGSHENHSLNVEYTHVGSRQDTDNLGTSIRIDSYKNCDIFQLDTSIKAIFRSDAVRIKEFELKSQMINTQMKDSRKIKQGTLMLLKLEYDRYQESINSMKSKKERYEAETSHLIELYKQHRSDPASDKLEAIIRDYIALARNYVDISVSEEFNGEKIKCKCGFEISKLKSNLEGTVYYCDICGTKILNNAPAYSRYYQPVSSVSNNYTNQSTFDTIVASFEGTGKNPLDEKMEAKLDAYFKSRNRLSGKEVRALSITEKKEKGYFRKELLKEAMKETKLQAYYKHIHLIGHYYWGWSLIDLTGIKDKIYFLYEQIQKFRQELVDSGEIESKSSINSNVILFLIFKILGYDVDIEQFRLVKTPSTIVKYNDLIKKILPKMGVTEKIKIV